MKKLMILLGAAGLLLALGIGLHTGLIALAKTDGSWAATATKSCATCHGA